MGIRKLNPITPGMRGATVSDFAELTPGAKPEKSLLRPKTKKGGRNNQGKITARHRGGGHKQQYRMFDFRRNKDGVIRIAPPASRCCSTPTARSGTSSPPAA